MLCYPLSVATAKQKRISQRQPPKKSLSRTTARTSPEARLEAAHAKFTQAPKGSLERDKAWEELTDALFTDAK
jgi:hypothetical protein